MALIDREKLVEAIVNTSSEVAQLHSYNVLSSLAERQQEILDIIEKTPTVDAVEVVRCKDCKHAHLTVSNEAKYCDMWSTEDELYLPPDFYCAAGERRDTE